MRVVVLPGIPLFALCLVAGLMISPATLRFESGGVGVVYESENLGLLARIKGQTYFWARWCGLKEDHVRFLSSDTDAECWFDETYEDIGISALPGARAPWTTHPVPKKLP